MGKRTTFFWIFTIMGVFFGSEVLFHLINDFILIGEFQIFPFSAPFIGVFLFMISFFGILYLLYSK